MLKNLSCVSKIQIELDTPFFNMAPLHLIHQGIYFWSSEDHLIYLPGVPFPYEGAVALKSQLIYLPSLHSQAGAKL